jgi:NAD(P)-dependent dehydrogenase (short-subunit alcohol dehydrogenase family)
LTYRPVLITGVSPTGVGEGTAIAIASQNPTTLILASRTKSKLDAVVSKILSSYPNTNIKTVPLDLSSQKSIREAATEINKLVSRLDILINNAGAVVQNRAWTAEHIELQFGTNHIGPFLLTNLLLPLLQTASKSSSTPGRTRIINLTSAGHRLSPLRFSDYNFEKPHEALPEAEKPFSPLPPSFARCDDTGYPCFIAYGQSKTANILFTVYLQEHLKAAGIASYALHPGNVSTDLSRNLDEEGTQAILRTGSYWKTPDEGAATTLVAGLDPKLDNMSAGLYLDNCQFAEVAPFASDQVAAEKLWRLSEELVGEKFALAR